MFLDEIGEIPLGLQSKLLRVLQEGEFERVGESRTRQVDVRVIAVTNRDLLAEASAGRFREDLYYRLSVFPINVPPLRERTADMGLLAEHFLKQSAKRLGVDVPQLGADQLRALEDYPWPGNVRELQNVLERATILARDGRLQLQLGVQAPPTVAPTSREGETVAPDGDLTLDDLKRLEREIVIRALERSGWRTYGERGAGARLNMSPTTLAARMKKMGIRRPGT